MKKIGYSIIAIGMMAAFCVFLVVGNVATVATPVVTVPGSYAEEYAKKHHLPQADVPDSISEGTELRYETFRYNAAGSGIVLEEYEGIGTEIVIPKSIGGKAVTEVGADFFSGTDLKRVTLPDTVKTVSAEAVPEVILVTSSGSALKEQLEEDGWTVETYADSDPMIFTLGDIPFEYSEDEGGVNLQLYTGTDTSIFIPAYINGKPVTKVSLDMLGYELVAFPNTVTQIDGRLTESFYTKTFAVELIFTIAAFVLALLVLNLKIGKLKNADEYVLTGPQVILTFVFFAVQIGFALWAINRSGMGWTTALLVSAVIMGGYLAFVFMGGTGRKHAITVTQKVAEKTGRMDDLKLSVANLADDVSDKDVKKAVTRLVEEIRYSDPTTDESLSAMEDGIADAVKELKTLLTKGEKDTILSKCEEIMRAVRERNEACKAAKSKGGR